MEKHLAKVVGPSGLISNVSLFADLTKKEISQLENKLNILTSSAYGNNAAIYYLDKAEALIDLAKQELSNPPKDISKQLDQIADIILKVEKMLQEST